MTKTILYFGNDKVRLPLYNKKMQKQFQELVDSKFPNQPDLEVFGCVVGDKPIAEYQDGDEIKYQMTVKESPEIMECLTNGGFTRI